MRAQEFTQIISLDEVAMNPKSLQALASKIPALAGMEFEMYVPNVDQSDDSDYQDRDYSRDESVHGFQQILDFFNDNDVNDRSAIRNLDRLMQSDYDDWMNDKFSNRWDNDDIEFIYDYLRENADHDDIAEILGREDDSEETKDKYGKNEYSEAADIIAREGQVNRWYRETRESALEDFDSDERKDEWAEETFDQMSDVENEYSGVITWPYWTTSGGERSIYEIANEFQNMIGRPVNASNEYHLARRESDHYVVEPDGSLESDSSDFRGLEFISPPLSIAEMFMDLKKVQKWADRTGCYTDESTGLHINVSIKNADVDKLDYVKLALLLGDQYILEQFNRAGNMYCKSAVIRIKDSISSMTDEQLQAFLNKMKSGLDQIASRFIINPKTVDKYTSIHPREGYIEFRSPGGDWLGELATGEDKIRNTLFRFIVALDAAYDPQKYRKEYLKKLSKILNPSGQLDEYGDMIQQFSEYVAQGNWPKLLPGAIKLTDEQQKILKSFRTAALQSLQQSNQTQAKKADAASGQLYWWRVIKGTQNIEVVAYSAYEAKQKAAQEWREDWRNPIVFQMYTARPVKPYQGHGEQSAAANYEIIYRHNITVLPRPVFRFIASNDAEARRKYTDWLVGAGIPPDTREYGYRRISLRPGEPTNARWRILIGGQQVFEIDAETQAQANDKAAEWLRQRSPEFRQEHGLDRAPNERPDVEVVPKNIQ